MSKYVHPESMNISNFRHSNEAVGSSPTYGSMLTTCQMALGKGDRKTAFDTVKLSFIIPPTDDEVNIFLDNLYVPAWYYPDYRFHETQE